MQAAWGQKPESGPFVLWLSWAWEAHGLVGVVILVGLVATYIALILGRHGRWLAVELRVWALAYPLYLLAVVRPITSMWRFLLLDFPIAARGGLGGDAHLHRRQGRGPLAASRGRGRAGPARSGCSGSPAPC